jgi:hypothetical protein
MNLLYSLFMKKLILIFVLIFSTSVINASSVILSGKFSVGLPNPPQNIDAGFWDGTTPVTIDSGYCAVALKNGAVKRFHQLVSGLNVYNGNFFQVENENGDSIRFRLQGYRPLAGTWVYINPEASKRIEEGESDCGSSGFSPFGMRVLFNPTDLAAASSGEYTESLTVRTRTRRSNAAPEVYDDFDVRIYIPYKIQVHQLNDIDFGLYAGSGNLTQDEEFCVYVTQAGDYSIMFEDDSVGVGYNLTNENVPSWVIPYEMKASMTKYLPTFYNLNKGVTYTGPNGSSDSNCTTGEKAYVRININEADIVGKGGGTYKSILTIIVAPL